MKKFVIASLAAVAVLAGSAVFARQAMKHMDCMHTEMNPVAEAGSDHSMMDHSMPGMQHHGMQSRGDMQNMKDVMDMMDSCQQMMGSR